MSKLKTRKLKLRGLGISDIAHSKKSRSFLVLASFRLPRVTGAGEAIGYLITISNVGPGIARSVMLSDTPPTNPGTSGRWAAPMAAPAPSPRLRNKLQLRRSGHWRQQDRAHLFADYGGHLRHGGNSATASASNEANTSNNSGSVWNADSGLPDS